MKNIQLMTASVQNIVLICLAMFFFHQSANGQVHKNVRNYPYPYVDISNYRGIFNDTLFLQKKADGMGEWSHIRVAYNKQKEQAVYSRFLDMSMNDSEKRGYEIYIAYIAENMKKSGKAFKHHDVSDLPKTLLPLYQYNNEYYLYGPCGGYRKKRIWLSDSIFSFTTLEMNPILIDSVIRIHKDCYHLAISEYNKKDTIKIYHIDRERGLVGIHINKRWRLYTDAEKASQYTLVIHSSNYWETQEFEFHPIDVEALIKEKEQGKPLEAPIYRYEETDIKPSFPGGIQEMARYLSVYVLGAGLGSRAIIRFVVEKDGTVSNLELLRSIDPYADSLALHLIKFMPRWTPGEINGKPVRTQFVAPVAFKD